MANGKSDWQTALEAAAKAKSGIPNRDNLGLSKRTARFVLTGLGNEATDAYHVLGTLQAKGARVIPEECRLRFLGTGSPNIKVQLKRAPAAGTTPVALSKVTDQINFDVAAAAVVQTLSGVTGAGVDTASLLPDDELRLYFTYGTGSTLTFPVTTQIVVEVTYLSSAS